MDSSFSVKHECQTKKHLGLYSAEFPAWCLPAMEALWLGTCTTQAWFLFPKFRGARVSEPGILPVAPPSSSSSSWPSSCCSSPASSLPLFHVFPLPSPFFLLLLLNLLFAPSYCSSSFTPPPHASLPLPLLPPLPLCFSLPLFSSSCLQLYGIIGPAWHQWNRARC